MLPVLAIAAAVGGAFLQQQAAQQAAKRQQDAIRRQLEQQRQYQMQAEQAAMKQAQDFTPDKREDRQNELEQQVSAELIAPVQAAMPDQAAASKVEGNVSDDYLSARANSQAQQLKTAEELARLLGRTTGANRLRQNEALAMAKTGQEIDRLGNFSRGAHGAAQVGIQQAGVPDGGMMLGGSILSGLGNAAMMGGFSGTATKAPITDLSRAVGSWS